MSFSARTTQLTKESTTMNSKSNQSNINTRIKTIFNQNNKQATGKQITTKYLHESEFEDSDSPSEQLQKIER